MTHLTMEQLLALEMARRLRAEGETVDPVLVIRTFAGNVRFARAQEVYAAVRHVVGAAIARAPWLRTTDDRPMRTFTPGKSRAARARMFLTSSGCAYWLVRRAPADHSILRPQ